MPDLHVVMLTPVKDFVEDIKKKYPRLQEQLLGVLSKIHDREHRRMPWFKENLPGTKGLSEVRARVENLRARVLCSVEGQTELVLLRGVVKKDDRLDRKDIEAAEKLIKSYREDHEKN